MHNPYTRGLAEYIANSTFEAIPRAVVGHVKRLVLDTLGAGLQGRHGFTNADNVFEAEYGGFCAAHTGNRHPPAYDRLGLHPHDRDPRRERLTPTTSAPMGLPSEELDLYVARAALEVVPVRTEHAAIACDACRTYGKGRHPAGLNFGDVFAYALAKATGDPLLFKGQDFTQTDIPAVPMPPALDAPPPGPG